MAEELWQRHEREIAELLGGWVTVGSGNRHERLDVQNSSDGSMWRMMVECKSTCGKGFSVTKKLWAKIREAAFERSNDSRPGLAIRLYGEDCGSNTKVEADLIAVPVHDLVELLEERKALAERVQELECRTG